MFNYNYFASLFNETHKLLNEDPNNKLIKTNLAALKALTEEAESEENTKNLQSQLARIQSTLFTPIQLKVEERNDEPRLRLEKDLLEYSRKLKGRALSFDKSVEADEAVVRQVEGNIADNLGQAEMGMADGVKSGLSVVKYMIYCVFVFFLMYFLIRLS
ncbi:hypothetical protein COBT_001868 [Conglomerata obtusa]